MVLAEREPAVGKLGRRYRQQHRLGRLGSQQRLRRHPRTKHLVLGGLALLGFAGVGLRRRRMKSV